MKQAEFDVRVKDLVMSKEELFKSEQTNELIEMIDKLRLSLNGR
ncbi:hypothetical protein LCGC14_1748510 [marine sediment metagenome]|uniref:Uncharacterized protein n=1 Tax=marine sediment metagenome TaxID=412755 RepID=A0A0F9K411_9ZZZZ